MSYNWAVVGDSSNLSLASNNTTATAIVSGLAPFESKEWTIRMTISDQSAKAKKSTSTDLKIKIEQDNSLPILTNLQIPGRNIYNNVSVTFDLYDLEGEHSSIQFEYSTDGAEWLTSAATVERSEPFQILLLIFFKGFIWQAHRSLPSGNYASAQIRLTPTDTYDRLGNTEISEPFLLSVPQAPQVSATIIDRICRDNDGETTINIESTSYNGGCVTETIDFHLDGFNDPHPYEDSFRFSWSSNSITTYQFIREIFKQNAGWDFGEEADAGRMNLSAVEYQSKLYFWGGTVLTAKEVFNTVYIYDPKLNEWGQGSAGGTGRRLHSAALYDGSIYHYGGRLAAYEGDKDPSTELQGLMDVYTIDTNSWKTIQTTTLDVGFRNNLAVVHDSKLYQFGGWKPVVRGTRTNSDYVNHMYVFDFSTNVWEEQVSTGAPTIAELEPMTANLHDGKIYYSGGQSSGMYRRIWSYEISTGNWARSAPADPVPWQEAFGSFSAQSSNYSNFSPTEKWNFNTGKSISIAPALNTSETRVFLSGESFYSIETQSGQKDCSYKGNYSRFCCTSHRTKASSVHPCDR